MSEIIDELEIVAAEFLETRGRGCRVVPADDTPAEYDTDADYLLDDSRVGARIAAGFELLRALES